jgi:hypothetical protein
MSEGLGYVWACLAWRVRGREYMGWYPNCTFEVKSHVGPQTDTTVPFFVSLASCENSKELSTYLCRSTSIFLRSLQTAGHTTPWSSQLKPQTAFTMPSTTPKSDPYIIYGRGGAGNIRTLSPKSFPLRTVQLTLHLRPSLHDSQRLEIH